MKVKNLDGLPIYFDSKVKPVRIIPREEGWHDKKKDIKHPHRSTLVFRHESWLGPQESVHDVLEDSQTVYEVYYPESKRES